MKHPSPTDARNAAEMEDLERRIREECAAGIACGLNEPELARAHFAAMAGLKELLPGERVAEMERDRGLRS